MFWKIFANAKNNILLGASFVSLRLTPVSLRLGHAAGLTVPRTVIQCRGAASLPHRGRPISECEHLLFDFCFNKLSNYFV